MQVRLSTTIAAAVIAAAAGTAHAAPYVYDFQMPSWTSTTSVAVYGTSARLQITMDNGGSTNVAQSFKGSQLTSIAWTSVGGTFAHTWFASSLSLLGSDISLISTDTAGVATLSVPVNDPIWSRFVWLDAALQQLQFGDAGEGITQFGTANRAGAFANALYSGTVPLSIRGQFVSGSVVPEPATLALLGIGLTAVFAGRRRRLD